MKTRHALIAFSIFILLGLIVLFIENPLKNPFATKDKSSENLFPGFSPQTVSSLQVKHPTQTIRAFKENGGWRVSLLSAPSLSYPADEDRVENLLKAVGELPLKTPISSNPEKYSLFRVDSSGTQVEMSGSGKTLQFIVGKIGGDGSTYLRILGSPEDPRVYAVETNLRGILLKPFSEWRSKRILNRDSSEIQKIELRRGNEKFTFELSPEKKWIWAEKPGTVLETNLVDSLARNLAHLKALSVGEKISVAEAGLERPQAEVTVKFSGDERPIQLKLGNLKGADTYYALLTGLKDWENEIFTIDQALMEKLKGSFTQP